jgi:hypothetical protein
MLFRPLAVVLAVFLVQTVSPADAQVTLKLKFTEGATYKFRNAQKVVQTIGLGEKTNSKARATSR